MPECPYCPACKYGLIIYSEDTMPGEEDVATEWCCLFKSERNDDETDTMSDSLACIPGTDQDDGFSHQSAEK